MDMRTCHCRNKRCNRCGKVGEESKLRRWGSDKGEPRFRCDQCGKIYEARDGTAYAGIRTDLKTYEFGAKLLAEGNSIRGTGRILEMDKDTVDQWVAQLGKHCAKIAAYFFRGLHLTECQLDELWTFVRKKEDQLTPIEQMLGLYGDTWVWVAFAPVSKLVPAWIAGRRTLTDGKMFVKSLKNKLDEHMPFFTSDDLPHYANALLDVYGQAIQPARTGKPGRPRGSYKVPPEDLLYAVVCKRREGSRVVEVTTKIIYGSPERIAKVLQDSPTSSMISTYGVERDNLTIPQHSRRMARRVNAFSKERQFLVHQLDLAFAYYHFVIPHAGLRKRLLKPIPTNGNGSPKIWLPQTPAMAAGLTDHVWSMDELLSFRVPPDHLLAF